MWTGSIHGLPFRLFVGTRTANFGNCRYIIILYYRIRLQSDRRRQYTIQYYNNNINAGSGKPMKYYTHIALIPVSIRPLAVSRPRVRVSSCVSRGFSRAKRAPVFRLQVKRFTARKHGRRSLQSSRVFQCSIIVVNAKYTFIHILYNIYTYM